MKEGRTDKTRARSIDPWAEVDRLREKNERLRDQVEFYKQRQCYDGNHYIGDDLQPRLTHAEADRDRLQRENERLRGERDDALASAEIEKLAALRVHEELRYVRGELRIEESNVEHVEADLAAARAENERLRQRVERLCASFDPTSGSGRARAFVGDLRAALSGPVAEEKP